MTGPLLLDGKVAIITGGARGQGAAEARRFTELGAKVVVTDILDELGRALASDLGTNARFVHHDVSDEREWHTVVDMALDAFGGIDALVNNAGIHWSRPLLEETPEDFMHLLSVDLVGPLLGTKAVAGPMSEHGGGSIVNVSSVAALTGMAGLSAYGSAKWGLRGLSKTAALELGPLGIRVNTVLPGPIATAMMHRDPDGDEARFRLLPLQRHGEPEEVADVVAFLCSDLARFVTGSELTIDGGFSAVPGAAAPPRGTSPKAPG